jgi:hypothetical protein
MKHATPIAEAAMVKDCRTVMDAAAALDLREVDFFRLAFRRWFGRDASAPVLERAFAAYMFGNVVPAWARHFSRVVLTDAAAGRLDPIRLGVMAFKHQPPPPRHGRLYVGVTLAVLLFYCAALLRISYDPQTSAPLPCYGGPGMKFVTDLAHAVSGTPPPKCGPVGGGR